ncbi:MAG: prolipoprotein diacylglyceryl transferase [Candidatus Gracilibacteria bacterium]|nr:prolipoprotein diacylglyceryl transferase [Candidatus Gracilibacteria bacterium]
MLKRLSTRYSYDTSIFTNNILWYFLSVFFFSRLFYVISKWNDLKYINNPMEFFIMSDYNFSLFGAIFGFFLVLYINVRLRKEKFDKYIDGLVLSFLFIAYIGFIGAFLGGQVYGNETNFGIEILYTHPFTPIPYQSPIFPLPIVYSIVTFILFSVLYIISMFIKIRGFVGYMGLLVFGVLTLILEFFTGKFDVFKVMFDINMTQILSLFLIIFAFYRLYIISKIAGNDTTVLISKK